MDAQIKAQAVRVARLAHSKGELQRALGGFITLDPELDGALYALINLIDDEKGGLLAQGEYSDLRIFTNNAVRWASKQLGLI